MTGKNHEIMLGRREKNKRIRTKDTHRRNKSESIGKRRKTKKNTRLAKQYSKNRNTSRFMQSNTVVFHFGILLSVALMASMAYMDFSLKNSLPLGTERIVQGNQRDRIVTIY